MWAFAVEADYVSAHACILARRFALDLKYSRSLVERTEAVEEAHSIEIPMEMAQASASVFQKQAGTLARNTEHIHQPCRHNDRNTPMSSFPCNLQGECMSGCTPFPSMTYIKAPRGTSSKGCRIAKSDLRTITASSVITEEKGPRSSTYPGHLCEGPKKGPFTEESVGESEGGLPISTVPAVKRDPLRGTPGTLPGLPPRAAVMVRRPWVPGLLALQVRTPRRPHLQ